MRLFLIRGLPGSGKSTYAKDLGCFHVEADMYYCRDSEYVFDGTRVQIGHDWCQKTALLAMEHGMDVCVSNTFTQRWELQPYFEFASKTGHEVRVICMTGDYANVHGVPAENLQNMRDRWENVDGEEKV